MEDMRIFTTDMPATLQIVGTCFGITKLANEVIYNIENTLINQGILAGSNISANIKSVIISTILNVERSIIESQKLSLAKLPPQEQLSSLRVKDLTVDETNGNIVISLLVTSVAGSTTATYINLGA